MAAFADELAVSRKRMTFDVGYGLADESKWLAEVEYFIGQRIEELRVQLLASPECLLVVRNMIDAVTVGYQAPQISYAEGMDPTQYETMVAKALLQLGWQTQRIGSTGDQGVDIVACKSGPRVAIQCKRYSSAVGNAAVQEVFAGKAFQGAHSAVVVGSGGFTRSAWELAKSTDVILLHHDELALLDQKIFGAASESSGPSFVVRGPSRAAEILRITPANFEEVVAGGLSELGWTIKMDSPSVIQDGSIVAERMGCRAIILSTGFFWPVSEEDVTLVHHSRGVSRADVAAIVTDQLTTDGARALAAKAGVQLLSHYDLAALNVRTNSAIACRDDDATQLVADRSARAA